MSRKKTNVRKIQIRKNGHGKVIYYLNIPEDYVIQLLGGKGGFVEITATERGTVEIVRCRK